MNWVRDARAKLRSLLLTGLIRVPIHREQLSAKQVQLAAQQYKFAEHLAEGMAVVAPKVSDRLEVRLQVAQQPDHLDIAMGLGPSRRLDRTRFR